MGWGHVATKEAFLDDTGHSPEQSWGSALGGNVMRAGQHYCEFTWIAGEGAMLGVVTDCKCTQSPAHHDYQGH